MKTKQQILEWLDKQPWKNEFYENHFKFSRREISYNENFIMDAFPWTCDGNKDGKWAERSIEYTKWYDSNDKPMSWEEYCEQNPIREDEYVIDTNNGVLCLRMKAPRSPISDITVMPKELCRAFVAYMKLIQLRNAWVKGESNNMYYNIVSFNNAIIARHGDYCVNGLSFPTKALVQEFRKTFIDLLEIAKPLL